MSARVLAFGEVLWDRLPSGKRLGGAVLNFAVRMAGLGERALVASRLGADALGDEAMRRMQALGLDTRLIQRDGERATGTVDVKLDAEGVPDFTINPDAAYDCIEPTDELLAEAAGAECICFGTLSQRSTVSRETCARVLAAAGDAVKLLDINLRRDCYTPETVRDSLDRADVLKLNEDELAELGDDFGLATGLVSRVAALNESFRLRLCVVTLGGRGAVAVPREGPPVYEPGYRVAVADTVGSGDAFTAGFAHKYLAGADLAECCRYGNALGALVATQPGGTEPIGDAEVAAFLAEARERVSEFSLGRSM